MINYFESEYILEEKVNIIGIPSIIFRPRDGRGPFPTIIHYHGWSSNKERQRIRGYIFATLGYQVILPDSINHGEREPLDDYGPDNSIKHFWPTVFQNLEESTKFIDELIYSYNADPGRIGIMGHSMGAISGIGVFVQDARIKAITAFNGTGAWANFNSILKGDFLKGENIEGQDEIDLKIDRLDPINNLDLINNRPMLLLHGMEDDVVPIRSQKYFYERVRGVYMDKRYLEFIKYQNTKHLISTNMLEDSIKWFKKHM